jgi:hypothetical protein
MEENYTPLESFDLLIDWMPSLPASVAEPLLASIETEQLNVDVGMGM